MTKVPIECYIPKCLSFPEVYSGHCWCKLRNPRWRPRWRPEINTRGCGTWIVVLISCFIIHQIYDIYFCSVCLNFLMIHLNIVSISWSMSNSRSNTKKSVYFITFFSYCLKVNLNGKKFFKAKLTRMYRL